MEVLPEPGGNQPDGKHEVMETGWDGYFWGDEKTKHMKKNEKL